MRKTAFACLLLLLVASCKEDSAGVAKPEAIALNEEVAGHFCQMVILEHPGPKAQIHLAGYPAPLWFSQVRDGIAYIKSPEQDAELAIFYVNDMGAAASWESPGENNWIDAAKAHFVVGSEAKGGMGAPEIVPFSDPDAALEFTRDHGGQVMPLADIPLAAALSPVAFESSSLLEQK